MQAVYFEQHGELDVLRYGSVPDPVLGKGEVLVRMKAAALNFNDIWARKGLPRVALPLPHISGTDGAGVIAALGPGTSGVRVGDEVMTYCVRSCRQCSACLAGEEVFCRQMRIWGFQTGPLDGSYAQYAKLQVEQVAPKPAHLSWFEAAATSTSLLSVWRMLVTRARVVAGEHVLVWGASGGTGSFALQLLVVLGAVPIAVTSSRAKAQFCERMGARHVILTSKEDVHETVWGQVRAITHGRGVDVVFDHVGATVWPTSVECLRWGGRLVICGATAGYEARIDLRYLWNKQLSFLGSHIGTHREWIACLKLVEQGKIRPPVTEVFPLAELAKAQAAMERREIMGKVAVDCA